VSFDAFKPDSETTNAHIDVQDDHYKLVRTLGAASTVLLKNRNGALPLGKHEGKVAERSLVLIGSGAGPGRMGPNEFADQGGVISGALAMGWGSGTANFTYLVTVSSPPFVVSFFDHRHKNSPKKQSSVRQGSLGRVFRGYWTI